MPTIFEALQGAALKHDVPLTLAQATAWHESSLNAQAVGDDGTSFGLFQLHEGGELGSLTKEQAFDPFTNADVALSEFADVKRNEPDITNHWGNWAAKAQRPAEPAAYSTAIYDTVVAINNGSIGEAFHEALSKEYEQTAPDASSATSADPTVGGDSTPPPPTVEPTFVTPSLPELREGNSGYPVRILQMILGGNLAVDGIFGPLTASSLESFQVSKSIPATKVVDVATWENLIGRQVR